MRVVDLLAGLHERGQPVVGELFVPEVNELRRILAHSSRCARKVAKRIGDRFVSPGITVTDSMQK